MSTTEIIFVALGALNFTAGVVFCSALNRTMRDTLEIIAALESEVRLALTKLPKPRNRKVAGGAQE
jgi:hypothetical protein